MSLRYEPSSEPLHIWPWLPADCLATAPIPNFGRIVCGRGDFYPVYTQFLPSPGPHRKTVSGGTPEPPFYNNGYCVRELQALVSPKPPQRVLVRGYAGLVVNQLFPEIVRRLRFRSTSNASSEAICSFSRSVFFLTDFFPS